MGRRPVAWVKWSVLFLCACTSSVPAIRGRGPSGETIVLRPGNYQPVALTTQQFQEGMRFIASRGSLPALTRAEARLMLVSADPDQLQKAAGYLKFCERSGEGYRDCWEVLTPSGGLDEAGSRSVALRIAFGEALRQATAAVSNLTPDQVRFILDMTLIGAILALFDPNPVTKALFMITTANLIAYVGVDLFNNVVRGFLAMSEELRGARDFAAVQAAGERYGRRLGPTLARLVLMAVTIGVAKFAGLLGGGASIPGSPQAAALAEAQGFQLSAAETAQSASLSANGTVTIKLGATAAMSVADPDGTPSPEPTDAPSPGEAHNAATELPLKKQLATESCKAELISGGGKAIAGAGADRPINDVARLVAQYGGKPSDWAKVVSRSYSFADRTTIQVHAYRNVSTGRVVEPKIYTGSTR